MIEDLRPEMRRKRPKNHDQFLLEGVTVHLASACHVKIGLARDPCNLHLQRANLAGMNTQIHEKNTLRQKLRSCRRRYNGNHTLIHSSTLKFKAILIRMDYSIDS